MDTDKRIHPRFNPNGLTAKINIAHPSPEKEITIEGTIIDMSYTGIKIKLHSAISADIPESAIRIHFTLPESGVPVSIHGIIKHVNDDAECGLQYSKQHPEHDIDDLMFECIKIANENIQRIII
jgi:hypothetical protein